MLLIHLTFALCFLLMVYKCYCCYPSVIIFGKTTPTEHPQIASKVTEINRISVVMYVSDQFVVQKLQLTHYRDPSTKLGFWVRTRLKRQEKHCKNAEI